MGALSLFHLLSHNTKKNFLVITEAFITHSSPQRPRKYFWVVVLLQHLWVALDVTTHLGSETKESS